jgi:hypothetical protein
MMNVWKTALELCDPHDSDLRKNIRFADGGAHMRRNLLTVLKVVTLSLLMLGLAGGAAAQGPDPQSVQAALGSGFTYQGQLKNANGPVTGDCDFRFSLWDSLSDTSGQIGATQIKRNVSVTAGLFTIPNLDFGSVAFTGGARWLQIAVKCAGDSSSNTLTPRQALMASPYALSLRPGAIISGTTANPGAALTVQQGEASARLGAKSFCLPNGCPPSNGVEGIAGHGIGVFGSSDIAEGVSGSGVTGVKGVGATVGIKATAFEANGQGIYAEATGANGTGIYASGSRAAVLMGNVGVGTDAPNQKLVVDGGNSVTRIAVDSTSNNAGVSLRQSGVSRWSVATVGANGDFQVLEDDAGRNRLYIKGNGTGYVGIGTSNPMAMLDVAGTAAADVVQIRGGSDLAEKFDVESNSVEPGTLMVIDDQHPGKLRPSDRAYDTRVAGVVSGAGGVRPGLTLQQQGVMEGNTSIAIAGRVYVRAEALSAPIEPGDLLTSSNQTGYAMKATDKYKSYGAIIGKAMTGLEEGTGLVLVLVNLQ